MNCRERFVGTLTGRPVDRVPFIKVFGGINAIVPQWEAEYPGIGKCIDELLKFEGEYRGWQIAPVNMGLSALPPDEVLAEDERQVVTRHGDGSVTIRRKAGDYHTQHVEWPVKSRRDWDRLKAEHLDADDTSRFPADWPDHVRRFSGRDFPLQLTHGGVYGFARRMMGDENLAYAFYDDPALVHDIMDSYTLMAVAVWEKMTAEVHFDLIECWEDMASKNGPLISPTHFREFMKPNYQRIAQFAAAHGIEIILIDSDGQIEQLTEWMLDAGATALYPYEVQAGNDAAAMLDEFPRLGVIGGLDKNAMAAGRDAINREMERAARLIEKGRFIPGPDHFVLSDVSFANYRYFMEQLRQVVMTTSPGNA
ncbi:MAG: uroporphyrinogen decarboxylase family protein [Planctomycetota bacterium]|jgi:uroporphyrinogen decarboxylase